MHNLQEGVEHFAALWGLHIRVAYWEFHSSIPYAIDLQGHHHINLFALCTGKKFTCHLRLAEVPCQVRSPQDPSRCNVSLSRILGQRKLEKGPQVSVHQRSWHATLVMATWWRRRRHRRPMSTCTFPTLRPVSRATPGASASDSPRHHCHHQYHHYQQPVKGGRGDIVVSPVTWTRGAGEPIEGRGGRGGGGMGAHRQSWRLSASSPAEYYIGHKLPPLHSAILGFLPVKAMLFCILIWPGDPATGSCVGKVADGRPVVRTLWTRPWSPAAVRATTQRVITQLEL